MNTNLRSYYSTKWYNSEYKNCFARQYAYVYYYYEERNVPIPNDICNYT